MAKDQRQRADSHVTSAFHESAMMHTGRLMNERRDFAVQKAIEEVVSCEQSRLFRLLTAGAAGPSRRARVRSKDVSLSLSAQGLGTCG